MAKVPPNIIDNLSFYAFGRLEREIEILTKRSGISEGDFASRISALLSGTQGGSLLGSINHMPVLPDDAATRVPMGTPALALADGTPGPQLHHGKSRKTKASRYRTMILKAMNKLTSPSTVGGMIRATGIPSGSIYRILHGMKNDGLIEYSNGEVSWGKESTQPSALSLSQAENKPARKIPSLPKGEPTRIVLKFMKNRQLTQKDAVHALVRKYPTVNSFVWNGVLTNSTRMGLLQRLSNGLLQIAGGKHGVNNAATAHA